MAIAGTGSRAGSGFASIIVLRWGIRTLLLVPKRRMQPNRNPGTDFRRNLRGTTRK